MNTRLETSKLRRLADLTTLISSGSTPKGGSEVYLPQGPVMLIRSQNVRMNQLSLEEVAYITDEIDSNMPRARVQFGDVLLNITGASIGRVSSFELKHVRANVNQHVCIIRSIPEVLYYKYLSHLIATSEFQTEIDRLQHGGTRQALTFSQIADFKIPLPSISEQRRIADVLDRAEALRAKRRAALAELDGLAQSIFIEMFGDPVTNPKQWPRVTLGDLILQATDGPHVSPAYADHGIPFLSARHIRPGAIVWEDLKYITREEAEAQWRKCKPQRGDILYTKGGTTGIAASVQSNINFAIWVHIALLRPNGDKVESVWLETMLNSSYCYTQSQRLTHGIANRDLGLKRMINIETYLPPLPLQREFVRRVAAVEKLKAVQRASLAELDALFASLQDRAFRGAL